MNNYHVLLTYISFPCYCASVAQRRSSGFVNRRLWVRVPPLAPHVSFLIIEEGNVKKGWIPEWPKGTDCKSVGIAFGGSNPPPPTILQKSLLCSFEKRKSTSADMEINLMVYRKSDNLLSYEKLHWTNRKCFRIQLNLIR